MRKLLKIIRYLAVTTLLGMVGIFCYVIFYWLYILVNS